MAGSLNHMVDKDGSFRFDMIENMRDSYQACEECFDIIAYLCGGDLEKLEAACAAADAPLPKAVPVLGARRDE